MIGNVINQLGRKEYAIVDYSKAIAINPNYVDYYVSRGRIYL